jgi:hypothetical protein
MTAITLEVPGPVEPAQPVVPDAPAVPADPVPAPEAPPAPDDPAPPQPEGPDVPHPDERSPGSELPSKGMGLSRLAGLDHDRASHLREGSRSTTHDHLSRGVSSECCLTGHFRYTPPSRG